MIYHVAIYRLVMLVEIPDLEVIFGILVAFLVGLFVFYAYYKIRPYVNLKKTEIEPDHLERLEYYERQLIDMKIRLDALDVGPTVPEAVPAKTVAKPAATQEPNIIEDVRKVKVVETTQAQRLPNMSTNNAVEYVLHLITDKTMTSRDIQITLGRSREHTSRLMKKLFEDGLVLRNEDVKPYTYSITKKGKEKIGVVDQLTSTA